MSATRDEIIASMARTLFVLDWADEQEEKGKRLRPGDLDAQAPAKTPRKYVLAALAVTEVIEHDTGLSIDAVYVELATRPGRHTGPKTPEAFGSDLAMMVMGTGVSWYDDHPGPETLKHPRMDAAGGPRHYAAGKWPVRSAR